MQRFNCSTLDSVTNNISLFSRKILDYVNHLVQKLLCLSANSRLTSNLCHFLNTFLSNNLLPHAFKGVGELKN